MKAMPGSQGVARPTRKVPAALQEKVKCELQRMENEGPTKQASILVAVAKKSVRLSGSSGLASSSRERT